MHVASNSVDISAEPQSKKRKTEQPEEVDDDDEVEVEDDGEAELEDDEAEADADEDGVRFITMSRLVHRLTIEQDEDADDTAKSSGPTAAAKARKGKQVPKEADLAEVEDDDEE